MPARLKPEWLARLREVDPQADLRFNALVHRWEFILTSADGVPRSQFWGQFYQVRGDGTRVPLEPDPVTGLHAFRDLDDAALEEACGNLERTFIGNRYDGAGTTRREVLRRHRANQEQAKRHYRHLGEAWADRFIDRLPRMRGTQQVTVLTDLTRKPNPNAQVLGPNGQPVPADRQEPPKRKARVA